MGGQRGPHGAPRGPPRPAAEGRGGQPDQEWLNRDRLDVWRGHCPRHCGARERRRRQCPHRLIPDGFEVADEPAELNASLVDSHVYMRWEKHGWQLEKINDIITRSTPRLFKQYNFRLVWADGQNFRSGQAKRRKLRIRGFGPHARYNSWVILKPKA